MIGLINLIFSMICMILSYLIYCRYEEMALKNKISITKKYMMKFVVSEISTSINLVDSHEQLDSINGWSRILFKWYLIGEHGYYVIIKSSGKMLYFQYYVMIPKKYNHKLII